MERGQGSAGTVCRHPLRRGVLWLALCACLLFVAFLVGLLKAPSGEAIHTISCRTNMKRIGLALVLYGIEHDMVPPYDDDGILRTLVLEHRGLRTEHIVCPQDPGRTPAIGGLLVTEANTSYEFVRDSKTGGIVAIRDKGPFHSGTVRKFDLRPILSEAKIPAACKGPYTVPTSRAESSTGR